MLKHKCKLCLKTFPNGKALGGHKRSHMFNLYVNPKPPHSPSSSSSSEIETKSLRRQSKRIRKPTPEPVSSISNTSPEEDVAYSLLMLSRDKWSDIDTDNESESEFKRIRVRNKYTCETCNKVFRSYQALGGHRASHKKVKMNHGNNNQKTQIVLVEDKVHQCPVCFRVFGSGQALGGHKRSHVMAKHVAKQSVDLIDLNLPAPTDDDDDDYEVSQFEVSVVSDGEFVKSH